MEHAPESHSNKDNMTTKGNMTTMKTRLASAQIRAARALLNWSMRQLSERSGVSQSAISRAERAKGYPTMHEQGLRAIKATLEQFGVEFLGESGVRVRSQAPDEQERGGPPSDQLSSDPFGSEARIS